MTTRSRKSVAARIRLPLSVLFALVVLLAPRTGLGDGGAAHAAGTTVNVQGNWVGTIATTTGSGDNCTFSVSQEGTNLSGGGTCQRTGRGSCGGTIDAATMKLSCQNAFLGTLAVIATISTDGTTATGTWTASNRAAGNYRATRRADLSASYGDPTNLAIGGYFYGHTDLAIPGRGIPFVFSRAYNSLDTAVGPLGPGWTHSFNVRLLIASSAVPPQVSVVKEDGSHDIYLQNTDGSYSNPPGVYATLVRDPDGTYTLTRPNHDVLAFDAGGRLTSLADQNGNTTNLSYNASGQLTAISDPAGRGALTLAYDSCFAGRLCSIFDWLSPARTVSFGYDANGRLQTVSDRDRQQTIYTYDRDNHLTTITDANNHRSVLNTYDSAGRLVAQRDAKDFASCVYYGTPPSFTSNSCPGPGVNLAANQAMTVDRNGNHTVYSYDSLNRVTRVLDSADGTTAYTYDSNGNRTSTLDPFGSRIDRCFDGNGNLTRLIGPAGADGKLRPVTVYSYQGFDLVQTTLLGPIISSNAPDCNAAPSLDPNLSSTRNSYDARHNLISTTRKENRPGLESRTAVTRYEYGDPRNPGLVTRIILPHGDSGTKPDDSYATTFAYYASGSQAGMLQSKTDPSGNKTTYTYDPVGRRLTVADPDGNANGGNPGAHTWTYTYDNEDRPLTVSPPAPIGGANASDTSYTYDPVGNRTSIKDGNGQITKYRYNERDKLVEMDRSPSVRSDPPRVTAYAYDDNGNLARVTRDASDPANAEVTDYFYDTLNRPLGAILYPRTVAQRHRRSVGE